MFAFARFPKNIFGRNFLYFSCKLFIIVLFWLPDLRVPFAMCVCVYGAWNTLSIQGQQPTSIDGRRHMCKLTESEINNISTAKPVPIKWRMRREEKEQRILHTLRVRLCAFLRAFSQNDWHTWCTIFVALINHFTHSSRNSKIQFRIHSYAGGSRLCHGYHGWVDGISIFHIFWLFDNSKQMRTNDKLHHK